jgi:hypothetical protein
MEEDGNNWLIDTRTKDPWEDYIGLPYVRMIWLYHSPSCACIRCDHKFMFNQVLSELNKMFEA